MPTDIAYQCDKCRGEAILKEGAEQPECCGQPMKTIPMDQCTLSSTAEHSRWDMDDEPCDDGRAG